MRRFFTGILFLLILVSCSTKKKGFLNRAYHNTTARYNGYFNAREIIKEGLRQFEEDRDKNYDEILPVFPYPTEDEVAVLFPQMNRAIEKTEKVIGRHSMEIRGTEYCRWIDDNYLAKGIGHYYKRELKEATSTFNFIAKRYPEESSKSRALGWLVRTHLENGKSNDASLVLPVLNKIQDLKRKDVLYRQLVNADYHIRQKQYPEALENISNAIALSRKRKERIRLTYIKGQLHQRLGNSNEAIAAYRMVAKKSPDYDLAFSASMSQATAVQGTANSLSVKKDLEKLLKDDKNLEYQDQIYYALAEISFAERDYEDAVSYLEQSIKASINNDRQKGKSFYRLAKYYFQEKLYQPASVYYDSTLNILPNTHPEYKDISSKAKNLSELVVHLNLIDKNDSLLSIAELDAAELDDRLKEIISNERERILREQREKEIQAQKAANIKGKEKGKSGAWYFYNPKTKQQGFKEFKNKWGDRQLTDNWRRSQSFGGGFSEAISGEEDEDSGVVSGGYADVSGVPSFADLRAGLPKTEEDKLKLTQEIKSSLYQAGLVYKENFNDINNSIESFENLLSRFDTTFYRLPAYYQLYRLYLLKENQSETEFFSFDSKSSSFYYKDLILYEYPDSEFARLIRNPETVKKESGSMKEAARLYDKAYLAYDIDSLDRALSFCIEGIEKYSTAPLVSKFYFLKARIHGHQKDFGEYEKTLKFLTNQFASTEEGKEAARLLAAFQTWLANNSQSTAGATSEEEESGKTDAGPAGANKEIYIDSPEAPHFYIVVIPDGSMNTNRAKIEVSNFNIKFYPNKKLDISVTFINNTTPILIVKGLQDKNAAKEYHNNFKQDKSELRVIARNNLTTFSISQENFKTLFLDKAVDKYLKFFEKNYK